MNSDQNSQTSPPPSQPDSNPNVVYPSPYPQLSYGQGYIAQPPPPGVYPQFYPQGQPVYPVNTIAYPPSGTFVPGQTYARQHICVAPPYNEREFTCLCGMHVHRAIIIISAITIAVGIAEIILEIVASDVIKFYLTMWPAVCAVIGSILLLVGNRLHIDLLYYPYLIMNVLVIFGNAAVGVLILIIAGTVTEIYSDYDAWWQSGYEVDEDRLQAIEAILYVVGSLYIVFSAFQIYFYVIVLRGFRFLKNYILNPNVPANVYGM